MDGGEIGSPGHHVLPPVKENRPDSGSVMTRSLRMAACIAPAHPLKQDLVPLSHHVEIRMNVKTTVRQISFT